MKKFIQIYLSIKEKYNLGPLISFRRTVAQIGWIPFVDHKCKKKRKSNFVLENQFFQIESR